jgi:hypothetical protein
LKTSALIRVLEDAWAFNFKDEEKRPHQSNEALKRRSEFKWMQAAAEHTVLFNWRVKGDRVNGRCSIIIFIMQKKHQPFNPDWNWTKRFFIF